MSEIYKAIPLSPLRKIIAERMTEAKQTIPHYRVAMDIEMDALLALRKKLNNTNPAAKVTVNDCIIKACANALMELPAINIQLIDETIHQYQQADISVITAVEGGLSTPVIRHADCKSLFDIACEVKSLASRAAGGQLNIKDIMGGSFSISNLGMFGVDQFDAIINPPQCAILAVSAAKPQVVNKLGEISTVMMMRVTLSVDHRAIDGAVAARFLTILREQIIKPGSLVCGDNELAIG